MNPKGKLFLLPTILADGTQQDVIPLSVRESIKNLQFFLCEEVRTARRFISSLKVHDSIESLHFEILNKDTDPKELPELLAPLIAGHSVGILSESGCPGIADPGALAVAYAHQNNILIVPMVGPSSILLALMASGLNGQQFAFHGYLPIDSKNVAGSIRNLERESREKNQTQIFIETPYRNNALMSHLIKALHPTTRLCAAANLTAPSEKIICQEVGQWKERPVTFDKVPVVFLFLAAS